MMLKQTANLPALSGLKKLITPPEGNGNGNIESDACDKELGENDPLSLSNPPCHVHEAISTTKPWGGWGHQKITQFKPVQVADLQEP